ncbi:MAG: SEC59/DGK1/VTE5 family protein [Myxococcales bacterium]
MSTELANNALDLQMVEYTRKLKDFLERLPRYLKRGRREEALAQVSRIVEELPAPQAETSWGTSWARMSAALHDLKKALDSGAAKDYVRARYDEATRAYEQWLAARRAASRTGETEAVQLGSLRPLMGPRTLFHISSGVVATVMYQFFLTTFQAEVVLLSILAVFGTLEITRRFSERWNHFLAAKLFHSIARPREYYRVNSSTLYVMALALVAPVFSKPAVLTGALILAFGDPAAAWLGRRFGTLKLYRSKSLVGSLAFVAAGTLVAGTYLMLFFPETSLANKLLAASLASLVGAVAELFSGPKLDDNLSIPIASTLVAALFV